MPAQRVSLAVWIGAALALGLVLGACTPGGQFDPTEVLSSDVFSTKKKLAGEREPLFPNGVPGEETGVPADLVKGYQPPPEQQAAVNPEPTPPAPKAAAVAAAPVKRKPKPKPKPAVARAPASQPPASGANDPAWSRAPTSATQAAPPAWPAPGQPTAQPGQPAWPAAPPPGQGQQTAQPAQPPWPNPSTPGTTYSR